MYNRKDNIQTRWISFENPTGAVGNGGMTNKGMKGNAYETIKPHESKTLCDYDGCGVINRIWMTLGALDPSFPPGSPAAAVSPKALRSLRIDMYWDGAATPAVSAPLGDFFGTALSIRRPFESALFSDPEGNSFNSYVKMPFRKNARIVVTNDGDAPATIVMYYKISISLMESHSDDMLYFHTHWNRETPDLYSDYTILPEISGNGRYLGANIGICVDNCYKYSWWGEGEVKIYIDGDTTHPTLVGTGAEDYPGSGYGIGVFAHRFQGCTYNDGGMTAMYRYHIEDPVYFHSACRVTIQQLGSAPKTQILEIMESGAQIENVVGMQVSDNSIYRFLDDDTYSVHSDIFADGDYFVYRRVDDWSSTAYFYLDSAEKVTPKLQDVAVRTDKCADARVKIRDERFNSNND